MERTLATRADLIIAAARSCLAQWGVPDVVIAAAGFSVAEGCRKANSVVVALPAATSSIAWTRSANMKARVSPRASSSAYTELGSDELFCP
mgnify:CR=1 FL=1